MQIYVIANELKVSEEQILKVIELLEDGATIPFIARYRKEATRGLDEVVIFKISEMYEKLKDLNKRKEAIIESLKNTNNYTDEIALQIEKTNSMTELEDIYLPFRPKRKTKGLIAREKGLLPLSQKIILGENFNQEDYTKDGVISGEEAVLGALDIIAEIISEDKDIRSELRMLFSNNSLVISKKNTKSDDIGEKFKDYYEYREQVKKIPSHRILAILRGADDGVLKLSIEPHEDDAISIIKDKYLNKKYRDLLEKGILDSYKRLLKPSLENELKKKLKEQADETAINIFYENLRVLLLEPPAGQKNILAIDPGLRTGSKIVCLNSNGKLLDYNVIKPLPPHNNTTDSKVILEKMVKKYSIEIISIGNGTGGREMEDFVKSLNLNISVILTNESGASVYSASECAREEFPELDLTFRGAISIGRRLMDPLAELVKIDPKAIGVGQYQHDVDQKLLKKSLGNCVEVCVNQVGVELNTASKELLSYVSGLNIGVAKKIIDYRDMHNGFKSRSELLKVKGLGEKVYEQSAGFIRVSNSKNILDKSSIHPERYDLVEKMAGDIGVEVKDLIGNTENINKIKISNYISNSVGKPTLLDIVEELRKPGRDPRKEFEIFEFDSEIKTVSDLYEGLCINGKVTNVCAFGAFVDIGVHQDGLVHISQLSDTFVKDPKDVVKPGDKVRVTVLEVDKGRNRISLTMKN
jgi:protein Tex